MAALPTRQVLLDRHEFQSQRRFDDVLADVRAALGIPDLQVLLRDLGALDDWSEYRAAVAAAAGTSGLMLFLELDQGAALRIDPKARPYRLVRLIAGNPVTMAQMTRTTPGAGAFAPITILLWEHEDAVHLRYDTITSAVGSEMSEEAGEVGSRLDAAVLSALAAAAR